MNINEFKVLSVDDEPVNGYILKEILGDRCQFHLADSAEQCYDAIPAIHPDLILLDVDMPNIDGIEVCKKLKNDPATKNIFIIFLSALASPDERLAGYMAGAEDYISKPFTEQEILAKVNMFLANREQHQTLTDSASEAMNMAMTAMTSAGELGQVLQFTRESYKCHSYAELGELLVETYASYGLDIAIEMNENETKQYIASPSKAVSTIEKNIFTSTYNTNRFVDYQTRTLMKYDRVSLLVRNMPLDDAEKYGRIKDSMGYLGEIAEARLIALDMELELKSREDMLRSVLSSTENTLVELELERKSLAKKSHQIFEDLALQTEEEYHKLGLSEEQEATFSTLLHDAEAESDKLYEGGSKIEKKIGEIVQQLSKH